jgi:hypothetical protein
MKLKLFTVYDSKAEAYLQPFYAPSTGQAIRSFQETCNTPDHVFFKYPEDFTIFEMGTFDDATSIIDTYKTPTSLGKAIEFKQQQQLDLNQPEMLKSQAS